MAGLVDTPHTDSPDKAARRAALEEAIGAWCGTASAAVCDVPLEPGIWMEKLAAVLRWAPYVHVEDQSLERHPSLYWKISACDGLPAFTPVPGKPRRVHTVVFRVPENHTSLRALWYWRWRGAQEIWFCEPDGWCRVDARAFFAKRLYRKLIQKLLALVAPVVRLDREIAKRAGERWAQTLSGHGDVPATFYPSGRLTGANLWRRCIDEDNFTYPNDSSQAAAGPVRVTQYVGTLSCGGAERQLCNLALGLAKRSHVVRVLSTHPLMGEMGHYAGLLSAGRVPAQQSTGQGLTEPAARGVNWDLVSQVPLEIRPPVIRLIADLIQDRPDVLHCWLDQPNIIGAIAGFVAGVPGILLSVRNSNPTNFPRLNEPYLHAWYQLLARSRRVHFLSNSHSGAASYASWIGVPQERFHVIFNGLCLDHFPEPTAANREAARREFGLSAADKVVCGIFRLAEEKQPELFLEVVRRVAAQVKGLRVLMAGTGPLEGRVRKLIRRQRMGRYVRLLGRWQDVGQVHLAGDVLLLTSTLEGCPNVVLEAEHFGLPVVATAGGGTCDAVVHGHTGYLAGVRDANALTRYLARLLTNAELRHRLSTNAQIFAGETFGLDQMVELTRSVYAQMLNPTGRPQRVMSPRPRWLPDEANLRDPSAAA
ncbi:MAG TPA: glycosyltransferase [Gemmataceae bacterium]|nr:glycosyltransferase [Gemmataceae bacterium]